MSAEPAGAQGLSRRRVLQLGATGAAGSALAACGVSTAPLATAVPTVATPSAWDTTVAAAKKEGKVVVVGPPGDGYRAALVAFSKAYPDISLEFSQVAGSAFAAKIIAERQGGQYLWDVVVAGAGALTRIKAANAFAPLKDGLVLPEVTDSPKWQSGFDAGFVDLEGKFAYAFQAGPAMVVWANRAIAPEAQITKFEQLLEPQWKGKFMLSDPRQPSTGIGFLTFVLLLKGEEFVVKLMQQQPFVTADERRISEELVRGTYPLAVAVDSTILDPIVLQTKANVKALDPDGLPGDFVTVGVGGVGMPDRAPHANAAKVYANWLLSKAGQAEWVKGSLFNSRRLDIDPPPGGKLLDAKKKYPLLGEDSAAQRAKIVELAGRYLV